MNIDDNPICIYSKIDDLEELRTICIEDIRKAISLKDRNLLGSIMYSYLRRYREILCEKTVKGEISLYESQRTKNSY